MARKRDTGLIMPPRIARERVHAWLSATTDVPVRIVCAPIGSGKTEAIKQYVAQADGAITYAHATRSATLADLDRALGDAASVVIDDMDRLSDEVAEAFLDRLLDHPTQRRYILVGSSRLRLGASRLLADGCAVAMDPQTLVFDEAEIEALARASKVRVKRSDVEALIDATDGWALAVSWIVRDAAERGSNLLDAVTPWVHERGPLVLEYLERAAGQGGDVRLWLDEVRYGDPRIARMHIDRLEEIGLPVLRNKNDVRFCAMLERIVADAATSVPAGVDSTAVLRVSLFGRFRCEFGGVELPFERRREKNVLAYVALAAAGGRTRDELIEAFWPGVPREIAAQNLRTALSRTRRALSDGLGGGAVERFFKTGNTIQLSETNTVIDVRRYTEHITTGKLEESRGDLAAARYHYATAEHLYGDGPLAGEPIESCFDEPLEALRQSHLQVLAKLVRLHAAASESEERRIYLMRLMNLAHDTELSESLLRATASTPDPS